MKIYIIINNLGVGGVQKMARFVLQSLEEHHECKLVGLFNRKNIQTTDRCIQLCPTRTPYHKVLLTLRAFLKKESPDVVLSLGSDAVALSYLATRGLNIKLIGSERNDPGQLSRLWKVATRFVYPRCDGFAFQLKEVMKYYGLSENNRVQVIPNAYFGKQYDSYVRAAERNNEISCASARVDRQKGLDILLKAFSLVHQKHPSHRLAIYGKLSRWEELKSLTSELGIDGCIDFKGQTDCLSDAIHSSRCFVLSSRYEGIPNTLIEAMASGVPTVSCDCPPGGPRMLTENGDAGLLCKVEDAEGLADCINRLLEDDGLCDTLSYKAQRVQQRFDASIISKRWVDLCESVLD